MKSCNWKYCLTGILLMLTATGAITACSGHKVLVKTYEPQNIIHIAQFMKQDSVQNLNSCIVFINKGDTIPLVISMDSDFMDFKQDQIEITAKQKLYFMVKMPDHLSQAQWAELKKADARSLNQWSDSKRRAFFKKYMLYVSKDAVHWAPLSNVKALRQVLGYRRGVASFGMSASTTNGIEASLNLRTVE